MTLSAHSTLQKAQHKSGCNAPRHNALGPLQTEASVRAHRLSACCLSFSSSFVASPSGSLVAASWAPSGSGSAFLKRHNQSSMSRSCGLRFRAASHQLSNGKGAGDRLAVCKASCR